MNSDLENQLDLPTPNDPGDGQYCNSDPSDDADVTQFTWPLNCPLHDNTTEPQCANPEMSMDEWVQVQFGSCTLR